MLLEAGLPDCAAAFAAACAAAGLLAPAPTEQQQEQQRLYSVLECTSGPGLADMQSAFELHIVSLLCPV